MIRHSRPTIEHEEMDAAARVLASGMLARGPEVEAFEHELAALVGTRSAVAVSSGSAALHVALLALGVRAGDEVVVPTYCCAALLNAVHQVGAVPVLADVDAETYNLTRETVRAVLTPRVHAVIVPHMFGLPADVPGIRTLGVPIVEDCAMTLGTDWGGRRVGSLSEVSVFSLYATKMVGAGHGGAVASSDPGIVREVSDLVEYDGRPDWRPRFNYALGEIPAAIARAQMARIDRFVARRRAIAAMYRGHLTGTGLLLPPDDPAHVYYRFVVNLRRPAEDAIDALAVAGIEAKAPVYRPLHLYLKGDRTRFPNTQWFYRCVLSLPIYPLLTDREVEAVVAAMLA